MKNFLPFALLGLIALGACNPEDQANNQEQKDSIKIGGKLPAAQLLEGAALARAQNVCESLREKAFQLNSRSGGLFDFKIEQRGCGAIAQAQKVTLRLQGERFTPASVYDGSYFAQVETHEHGMLAPLCQKVLAGVSTSNSIPSGARRQYYEFFADTAKTVKVRYTNGKNSGPNDPVFVIDEIQTWTVDVDAYGQTHGFLLSQIKRVGCGAGEGVLSSELLAVQ